MAHMENVPDMAIFTPVQTTTIAASPRHSVLPALRIVGPLVRHDVVHDLIQIPFEVVQVFVGDAGRDGGIDLLLRQGGRGDTRSSATRARPAARMSGRRRAAP